MIKRSKKILLILMLFKLIMLSSDKKLTLISKFQGHKKDTGSCQIQIVLLTEKIKELSSHLKEHPKDNHSRRGLLKMVARRKKLIEYLKQHNEPVYESLAKKLGLGKKGAN